MSTAKQFLSEHFLGVWGERHFCPGVSFLTCGGYLSNTWGSNAERKETNKSKVESKGKNAVNIIEGMLGARCPALELLFPIVQVRWSLTPVPCCSKANVEGSAYEFPAFPPFQHGCLCCP